MDTADQEFVDHMNSLSPREQQMMDGVELGGIRIEQVDDSDQLDNNRIVRPPTAKEAILIRRVLDHKLQQLQGAADRDDPPHSSLESRANRDLAHYIWGVLRWLKDY